MLSNWPIVILAASVMAVGVIGVVSTRHNQNGIAAYFWTVTMVAGIFMLGGTLLFFLLSLFIYVVRGH